MATDNIIKFVRDSCTIDKGSQPVSQALIRWFGQGYFYGDLGLITYTGNMERNYK